MLQSITLINFNSPYYISHLSPLRPYSLHSVVLRFLSPTVLSSPSSSLTSLSSFLLPYFFHTFLLFLHLSSHVSSFPSFLSFFLSIPSHSAYFIHLPTLIFCPYFFLNPPSYSFSVHAVPIRPVLYPSFLSFYLPSFPYPLPNLLPAPSYHRQSLEVTEAHRSHTKSAPYTCVIHGWCVVPVKTDKKVQVTCSWTLFFLPVYRSQTRLILASSLFYLFLLRFFLHFWFLSSDFICMRKKWS